MQLEDKIKEKFGTKNPVKWFDELLAENGRKRSENPLRGRPPIAELSYKVTDTSDDSIDYFLTQQEVAAYYNCSQASVGYAVKKGTLLMYRYKVEKIESNNKAK